MTTTATPGPAAAAATAGAPERDVVEVDVVVSQAADALEVRLTCAAVDDRSRGAFVPPVAADVVARFAESLADAQTRHVRPRGEQVEDVGAQAETIGRGLFEALFDGSGRRVLTRAQDHAKTSGSVLRIRLLLDGVPAVARLPWELLLDGERHLVHTTDEFVVRYSDEGGPLLRARRDGPLRVLVVPASPLGMQPLAVGAEYERLVTALAPVGDRVLVRRLDPPTLEELRRRLPEDWHVLHFMGHGGEEDDGSVIALELPDRTADLVPARTLAQHLAAAPGLRLAVLNGCSTGAVPLQAPHDGVAHALVGQGVAAAVAMQFPVTDAAAIEFAAGLYEGLAAGALVDEAVARGRSRLLRGPEWVTPVLYARTGPRLFEAPPPPPPVPDAGVPRPRDRVPRGVVPTAERFQPRPWVVEEVGAWLASDSPLLLLTGDHGTGKSVLAGWLAGQGPAPDDDPALAAALEAVRGSWHAVQMSAAALAGGSIDPRSFVRDLAEQLAGTVPHWSLGVDPADPALSHLPVLELWSVLLEQPLRAALRVPGAVPVVVLVDGLDEAGSGPEPTTLSLLARLAGLDVPVRLLLAGPDDDALVRPFANLPDVRRVDLSAPARRPQVDADVRAYLERLLAADGVAPDLVERVVEHAAGSFLYARHAADQIRAAPAGALGDLTLPGSLDESYDRHVRRVLERVYGDGWEARWADAVAPLLGQLAVARAPVPRAALQTWLGWSLPRLAFLLDELAQLVVCDEQGCRLSHPSLGAMLRAPTLASGGLNALQVDVPAAHRRVVAAAAVLTDADLARPVDVGGTYALVHAPWHLEQLRATAPEDALTVRLVERVLTPQWAEALAASVTDPVLVGLPYRDLLRVLLERGRHDDVERLVRLLASTSVPVLRGAVFEVLLGYVEKDAAAAEDFLVRLATGGEPEVQAIALHATCLLPAAGQASAFRRIVTTPREGADVGWGGLVRRVVRGSEPSDELGRAAAFALYANGRVDPQGLIRGVLDAMLPGVSLSPARLPASFAVVELFGRVTVTNYVNGCSDPAVTQLTSDLWHALLVDRLGLRTDRGVAERVLVEPALVHELSRRIQSLFTTADMPDGPGADAPGAAAAARAVRLLDPAEPAPPHEADLRTLLLGDVTLFRILAALVLGVHGIASPATTAPLVRSLLGGLGGTDPAAVRARRWLLLAHAVVLPEAPEEWVPLLEDLTRAVLSGPHDDADEEGPLHGLHLALVPLGLAYARAGRPLALHAEVLRRTAVAPAVPPGGPADGPVGGPRAAAAESEAAGGVVPLDAGYRSCCLQALGVVGLYHPDAVLDALGALADDGVLPLSDAVPALAITAAVHPLRTRAWLLARGERGVLDAVSGSVDIQAGRHHLEFLGMYTNGVHQSLHYPQMRERLCQSVFTLFLESRNRKEWAQRYTRAGLAMLRDAEYELIRWTR